MDFDRYLEQANRETNRYLSRVLTNAIRYWWVFLVTSALSLLIAFFTVRYSSKVYEVGAKVMVDKVNQSLDPTSLLFEQRGLSASSDVVNELIILKSFPLLQNSVVIANQHVSYFRTTSALERIIQLDFSESPYKITPIGEWQYQEPLIGGKKLTLIETDEGFQILNDDELIGSYTFNDTVVVANGTLMVERRFNRINGLDYYFSVNSVQNTVLSYQSKIEASLAQERSTIVALSLETDLPEKEITFINVLLQNYMNGDLDEKNISAENTIKFINNELRSIKDSLSKIESRLELFKSRNRISNLQTEGQKIFDRLLTLEEEKASIILQQKYIELVSSYLSSNNVSQLVSPSSFGIKDEALNSITNSLLKLSTERKLLGETSSSEIALQYDLRLKDLNGSLESYVKNVEVTNKLQLQDLNNRISTIEKAIQGIPGSEMTLMNIERLHSLSERLYLLLLEKRTEAEITKSSNTSDIKIVESPRLLSIAPIKPKKTLIYMGLFLLGISLPLGGIAGYVFLNNSIIDKEEITSFLELPFLGEVSSSLDKPDGYIISKPKSRLAESFRSLRSSLKYFNNSESSKVVLVTSCFPGEGKTFISANLALSSAFSGLKTIIIGADLRKPKLHDYYNVENEKGLSTFLTDNATLEDVVKRNEVGLDIITSGPNPPNPLELLDSPKFTSLLSTLKTTYDLIIIDTSPFVLVSDAKVLFPKVDLNLIVLRSNVSKRTNLSIIAELKNEFPTMPFATVLNDKKQLKGYGYGRSAYNGYGYYDEN